MTDESRMMAEAMRAQLVFGIVAEGSLQFVDGETATDPMSRVANERRLLRLIGSISNEDLLRLSDESRVAVEDRPTRRGKAPHRRRARERGRT